MSALDSSLAPLRVLFVLPASDQVTEAQTERTWAQISAALAVLRGRGRLEVARVLPGTEAALCEALERNAWHVVHIVGQGRQRRSARYCTLTMESASGGKREVTSERLTKLIRGHGSVRMVVLQPSRRPDASLTQIAMELFDEGRGVGAALATEVIDEAAQVAFAAKWYANLLYLSPSEALVELRLAVPASGASCLFGGTKPLVASQLTSCKPPPSGSEGRGNAGVQIRRKRELEAFDVFLCHNSADKPAVMRVGESLIEEGILPWLDEWELLPGQLWQRALEHQIGGIRSVAVFVGAAGLEPWQEHEIYAFLREFVRRGCPVIPVLLPDAPARPELPVFLRGLTWVDYRRRRPDPFARLIWGITGARPEP